MKASAIMNMITAQSTNVCSAQSRPKMSTEEFLETVLPSQGHRCVTALLAKGGSETFKAGNDEAARVIAKCDRNGLPTYFACASYSGTQTRRSAADVVAVKAFWVDVDCGAGKPYPNQAAGLVAMKAALKAIGLPMPMIVDSGNGLHLYWTLTADIDRETWQGTARLLKAAVRAAGLHADPTRTADVASILRPPATFNRKDQANPLEVKVLRVGGVCEHAIIHKLLTAYLDQMGVSADDIALLPGRPAAVGYNDDLKGGLYGDSRTSGAKIAESCAVMAELRDSQGNVPYPHWYKCLGLLAHCEDGERLAHKWSAGHPTYDAAQTQRFLDKQKSFGPTICQTMHDGATPATCQACPHWGKIKTPMQLGRIDEVVVLQPAPHPPGGMLAAAVQGMRGAPIPLSAAKHFMTEAEALEFMNGRYAWCNCWGEGGTYIEGEHGDKVRPIDTRALLQAVANIRVSERLAKDGQKWVAVGPWWMKHPDRRTFDRALYDPEGTRRRPGEVLLPLWHGFDVDAQTTRGTWRRMQRHIWQVWCGGDPTLFRYVMRWFAHAVQKPGTIPGTVLVVKSKAEGTGKTIVTGWLQKMFGKHALAANSADQVTGRFNDHLEQVSLLVINEPPFAGDRERANKFKSMVTEDRILIERKFGGAYMADNQMHIISTSNEAWTVQAGADARRYVVLEASDKFKGDHSYFDALAAEAEGGGVAAMFDFLLRLDIRGFNPRAIPITAALIEQQNRSLPVEAQWALAICEDPAIAKVPDFKFEKFYGTTQLNQGLQDFCQALRKQPPDLMALISYLKRLGLDAQRTKTARGWQFPDEATFKALVLREAGVRVMPHLNTSTVTRC